MTSDRIAKEDYVDAAVATLVDSAPGTLDTLNELAAALGDDANFATTVTNALAGKQPLDSDLTAIAALTTTSYGRAFLELANAAAGLTALGIDADLATLSVPASTTISAFGASLVDDAAASNARTTLGLGTAATNATGDFQPIDSDLTAIAALTTTSFGRGLLELANAAAAIAALGLDADIATLSLPASTTISAFGASLIDDAAASNARTTLGLGTAATSATGDFDAAGAAAAAQAASQPLDSDLTTVAGLTATTDNIIQSVAGAWASRTPAQVRTALALVIGTNVQAWDADLDAIAGLTPTTDNLIQSVAGVWASRTPAQLKATLALAKGDVGLGNVDNTADTAKPVSTAQQTALDLKANLASPTFTGSVTIPGGTITGITDLAIADGGTGASTAPAAVANLFPRTTFSNANYTALATDFYVVQVGTMSAARTVTLPAANTVAAGKSILVADESGTVTVTNTIIVARAGSDTINGATSATITNPYGFREFFSDGTSVWTSRASVADYTEGNWTPVVIGSTTAGSITYTVQTGRYTRIGRMAYVSARIVLASLSTAAGNVRITGLPFTVANTNGASNSFPFNADVLTTAVYSIVGRCAINTTYCECYHRDATHLTSTIQTTIADLSATTSMIFAAAYMI